MSKYIEHILSNFFRNNQTEGVVNRVHRRMLEEDNREQMDDVMRDLWDSVADSSMDEDELDTAYDNVWCRISGETNATQHAKMSGLRRWARIAAMWIVPLMLVGALAWMINDNLNLRKEANADVTYANYYAPMGENIEVTLADNSKVWLHGGSTLVVASNYNKHDRRVFLTGEGFFKVAHNEEKKFVVSTGDLEMQVLGTEFNISSYPEDTHVLTTLEKGKLKVTNTQNQEAVIMHPGDQVSYSHADGKLVCNQVTASDYSSWRYGYIFINNIQVRDLLTRLERSYDVKFVGNRNAAYMDQRIRARFNKDEDLNNILKIVKMLVPQMNYQINGDTVYLR